MKYAGNNSIQFGRSKVKFKFKTNQDAERFSKLWSDLDKKQERLPPDFEKAIFENLDDLYEVDPD